MGHVIILYFHRTHVILVIFANEKGELSIQTAQTEKSNRKKRIPQ